MSELTPYLAVGDARAAIEWYAAVFGAVVTYEPIEMPDGRIGHIVVAFAPFAPLHDESSMGLLWLFGVEPAGRMLSLLQAAIGAALLTMALGLGACSNMSHQDKTTAAGAAIGGVAGSVLRGGGPDHAVATSKTFRSLARICGAAPSAGGETPS